MRKAKFIYSALPHSKGVNHHHLCFGRHSKAGRKVGKLYVGENKRLQVCPDWRLLAQEAVGRLTRRCDWLGVSI